MRSCSVLVLVSVSVSVSVLVLVLVLVLDLDLGLVLVLVLVSVSVSVLVSVSVSVLDYYFFLDFFFFGFGFGFGFGFDLGFGFGFGFVFGFSRFRFGFGFVFSFFLFFFSDLSHPWISFLSSFVRFFLFPFLLPDLQISSTLSESGLMTSFSNFLATPGAPSLTPKPPQPITQGTRRFNPFADLIFNLLYFLYLVAYLNLQILPFWLPLLIPRAAGLSGHDPGPEPGLHTLRERARPLPGMDTCHWPRHEHQRIHHAARVRRRDCGATQRQTGG
jgi:hypothetical protein